MMYSLPEAHKLFRRYFDCKPPINGLLTAVLGRPVIDLIEFDKIFHVKHGDYEDRNMSMLDVLEKEYPAGAAEFIEWFLGVDERQEEA